MEFHENKAKTPFIGFVQLWQAVRRWGRQMQTRRVLQQMSDERLRDIGLRREDVECTMGGVLANAACLHSKLLQNPTIKVVYNIFF